LLEIDQNALSLSFGAAVVLGQKPRQGQATKKCATLLVKDVEQKISS
jgi:hypothetical protein